MENFTDAELKTALGMSNYKTANFIESDDSITEVTFDDLEVELLDRVEYSSYYKCTGFDNLGRQYEATIERCCGEYEDITDIERISYII